MIFILFRRDFTLLYPYDTEYGQATLFFTFFDFFDFLDLFWLFLLFLNFFELFWLFLTFFLLLLTLFQAPTAFFFDSREGTLVTATSRLKRWPLRADYAISARSDCAITDALYNPAFHQVVTAQVSASSAVWNWGVQSGDLLSRFTGAHGTSAITAMAFDGQGRRLITGSHDGTSLNMWNFSSGSLLKQFRTDIRASEQEIDGGGGGGR